MSRKSAVSISRRAEINAEIKLIILDIRKLLDRIEDAVPLINLAITTSGASLSTTLPATVSPSRLLQASTFLTAGDTQYAVSSAQAVQVGPTFFLSVYLLFAGHVRPHDEDSIRNTTWKEVMHKARVKLRRVPMNLLSASPSSSANPQDWSTDEHIRGGAKGDEFAYQILIIEDLDDDRVHTFEPGEEPSPFDDVKLAGIREVIPIHEISKIFYADTGKILNIGSEDEPNHPIILLKRDVNAIPPRKMMNQAEAEYDDFDEEGSEGTLEAEDYTAGSIAPPQPAESTTNPTNERWRFPPGLDLEWIAFEVYNEPEDSDSEDDQDLPEPRSPPSPSAQLHGGLSRLRITDKESTRSSRQHMAVPQPPPDDGPLYTVSNPLFNNIKTSLSLLEMLLRLTSLQQFQQQSHLSIPDELLNFFLEESSTTGAGGDEHHRQRVRAEARRKVGWDPYDESPLKRRGEDYQYGAGQDQDSWAPGSPASWRPSTRQYSPNVTPRSKGYRASEERYSEEPRRNMDGYRSRQATASPSPSTTTSRAEGGRASDFWKRRTGQRVSQRESSPLVRRESVHDGEHSEEGSRHTHRNESD